MHRANTETDELRGLDDPRALGELGARGCELFLRWAGPTKAGAHDARLLAGELAVTSQIALDAGHAGLDPSGDHLPLEFRKHRQHAEHGAAAGCGRVERLRVNVQPRAGGLD